MDRNEMTGVLGYLGHYIRTGSDELENVIRRASVENPWFTPENCRLSLLSIADSYLDPALLSAWVSEYRFADAKHCKTVGVVAAGNIPLVAIHDVIAVLMSGHRVHLKLSSKDKVLLPHLAEKLEEAAPGMKNRIRFVERLNEFDAVIATGSNQSARYFEYYFGKYPNIIRKNRNSVSVISEETSDEELVKLGSDIFTYFGLGCRNVSKLYLPAGFNLERLGRAFEPFRSLMDHNQYRNNLDYNRTLLLMNSTPFLDVDFVNITENKAIPSPISSLHFMFYDDIIEVENELIENAGQIQCVVGADTGAGMIPFGQAQSPGLSDYADNIDTMAFLSSI